jgi:hypothetical protein
MRLKAENRNAGSVILKRAIMNTGNSNPEKDPGKAPEEKTRKNPDTRLNRDINKHVQGERFPESNMSKDSRKDAEEVAGNKEAEARSKE